MARDSSFCDAYFQLSYAKDIACEQLARALTGPSGLTYGELKLMPMRDPLRGDPRFQKIVASLAPKE